MAEKQLIHKGQHTIYKDGNTVIKEFAEDFPKTEVLNEALNTARVEDLGLHVPHVLAVSVHEGCWAITSEYVEGTNMADLIRKYPEKKMEYLEMMVDLQIEMHSKKCPLLNRLKEKMARQIQSLDCINEITRYDLLTRLDGMKKHLKLCHGDFRPDNIIVGTDGNLYIVDWVHASQGNASADVARTYLSLTLFDLDLAHAYLNLFCDKTDTDKAYVQGWMPIVAASQLSKKRPEEKELLESWINVVDYQ